MKSFAVTFAAMALCLSLVDAFAPNLATSRMQTSLSMKDDKNKIAVSFVAAAFLAGSLLTVEPVFAAGDFGSSQIVAARSGGRAGGRSSAPRSYSAPRSVPRSNTVYRSGTTTIVRPMIAPSPIIVSPFGYSPFGYNPLGGGFGLGYGLGAMSNRGDEMRDYRQEAEIQKSSAELEQAKIREAELEARIRALEKGSAAPALQVVQ
jgi:hypothetical protein